VLLVLIVELLNSGIEATVDRISLDLHDLSKRAKDFGSAAVMLALLLCAGVWLGGTLWAAAVHEPAATTLCVFCGSRPGADDAYAAPPAPSGAVWRNGAGSSSTAAAGSA
jgi:hypothetical protein